MSDSSQLLKYIDYCIMCGSQKITPGFPTLILGEKVAVMRCMKCKTLFKNAVPAPAGFDLLYNSAYFSWQVDLDYNRKAWAERYQRLSKYFPEQGQSLKHLDVGCGNGVGVLAGLHSGFDSYGIEPNEIAVNQANPELKNRVKVGYLTEGTFTKNAFDLITFWAVIEHLSDPAGIIKTALSILKPGGIISLDAPNGASWHARYFKNNWFQARIQDHLVFPSPYSFKLLCEALDARLLKVRYSGSPFPFGKCHSNLGPGQNPEPVEPADHSDNPSGGGLKKYILESKYSKLLRSLINYLRLGDSIEVIIAKKSG